ncbi:MAG TPA: hypothetical protein VFJ52_00500 [Terriglobia bacterium]|nr:hypothetical protein [Terriglobia bacterium]
METLESQQKAVYQWIAQAIRNNGPPPQELAEEIRRIYGILVRAAQKTTTAQRKGNE